MNNKSSFETPKKISHKKSQRNEKGDQKTS
jgi:hypothetical protein